MSECQTMFTRPESDIYFMKLQNVAQKSIREEVALVLNILDLLVANTKQIPPSLRFFLNHHSTKLAIWIKT